MAPAKMRGKHNNLLREVGEAAGIVDEIKQMLTKTQIGDSYDPHTWHETEVPVHMHWLFEGKLNADLKFSHALARAPFMREVFGAKADERLVVMTKDAIYVSKRNQRAKLAPEQVRKMMRKKTIEDMFIKYDVDRSGSLNMDQLGNFLKEVSESGLEPSKKELRWVVQEATTETLKFNHESEEEFPALDIQQVLPAAMAWDEYVKCKEEIEAIYKKYDTDNSHSLDRDQLTNFMTDYLWKYLLTIKLSSLVDQVMHTADVTNSGNITKPEMIKALSTISEKLRHTDLTAYIKEYTAKAEALQLPGLKWEDVGAEKPTQGTEINNVKLAEALQQKITEFAQAAATPVSVEFNKDELDQCEMSEDEFRMLSFDAYVEVDFPNGDPSKYFKPVVADGLLDKELFKSFLADTSGVSGVLPSEHELLWVAQEALGQNGGGETDGTTLVRPEWGNLGLKADHLSHAARAWSIYVDNQGEIGRIFEEFDRDNTDSLCRDQLTDFIKELPEMKTFEMSENDVTEMVDKVMNEADDLNNGAITKPEMIKTLSIIRNDLAERRLTQALHKYTQLDGGALKKEDLKSLLQELGKREPAEKAREPTDKELLWVIQEATTEVLHFVDNNEKTGADMEYWVRKLKRCDLPRAVVSWEHYMRQSSEIEKIFKEFDDDESGSLDKRQLKNFMRTYLNTQLKDSKEMRDKIDSKVDRVLAKADVTGSGGIEKPEMIKGLSLIRSEIGEEIDSIAVKDELESKRLSAALKMEAQPSGDPWPLLQEVHGGNMRSESIAHFKGIVVKAVYGVLKATGVLHRSSGSGSQFSGTSMSTDESGSDVMGLKWEDVGPIKPYGKEITSAPKLATALSNKTNFTQEEWNEFGVHDLHIHTCIKAGGIYFKPAADVDVQEFLQNISDKKITWTELNHLGVDVAKLRWQCIGTAQPTVGRRLINSGLSNALKTKTDPDDLAEFIQEEWNAFDITSDLQFDDFLQSGDFFFRPTVAKGVKLNRQMLAMYMALREEKVAVDVFLHHRTKASPGQILSFTGTSILNFTVKLTAEQHVLSVLTQSAFTDHLRHYLQLDLPYQFPKNAITMDVRESRRVEDPLFKPSDWQLIDVIPLHQIQLPVEPLDVVPVTLLKYLKTKAKVLYQRIQARRNMEPSLPVAVRVSLRIAMPPWNVNDELVAALVKAVGKIALRRKLIGEIETTRHARRWAHALDKLHPRLKSHLKEDEWDYLKPLIPVTATLDDIQECEKTDKDDRLIIKILANARHVRDCAKGGGDFDAQSPRQVARSSALRGRPRITIQKISAVSSMELMDNDRFAAPEQHTYDWDVFLSYRVDADRELVEQLYDKLTSVDFNKGRSESLKVYWDHKALKTGEDFTHGFSKALVNSRVVVLVISRHTFHCSCLQYSKQRLGSRSCTCNTNLLQKSLEDKTDNVLKEHDLALELFDLGRVKRIVPLLVGDKKAVSYKQGRGSLGRLPSAVSVQSDATAKVEAKIYGDFFKDSCLDLTKVPCTIMKSVQGEALQILRSDRELAFRLRPEILVDERIKAGTNSLTKGRTPQQTIETILGLQGLKVHGIPENTISLAVRKIVDAVDDPEKAPHDLEPDPHTRVEMIIDAFDNDSEDDKDLKSVRTRIKERADQWTNHKRTEDEWRAAISTDIVKTVNAIQIAPTVAEPTAMGEICAENTQREWALEENDLEAEVHFLQDRGKTKVESRGALLITIHGERASGMLPLSPLSKPRSQSLWQDKTYTMQMCARHVLGGKNFKSLKISLESDTVMHTDEDEKEGHGNYNWKELEMQVSKPGPDGSFLFAIKQPGQNRGEGANFKEGDIVQVVPANANPGPSETAPVLARRASKVALLTRSASKVVPDPSDQVLPQVLDRDTANLVGVVTSVSKSSNYVSVTLLAKNSPFESQDQQHVVKQYPKHRLEKLWLADASSTLLIECVESLVRNTVGFCRVTLDELLKDEGFKGHRSHLVFFSHEDKVPQRCPFVIRTTCPRVMPGQMHGDSIKRKTQSNKIKVPTIVPLPEKFVFFSSYVSVTEMWCHKITEQVKRLKWEMDPVSSTWFEVREKLDAIHNHVLFASLVWFAVMVCFVSSMNRWWSPTTETQEMDEGIDDVLFAIFAVELVLLTASKFPACLNEPDFYLNLIVVVVSLIPRVFTIAVGNDALALRSLRLLRLVSTLRFFKWFHQLGEGGNLATVAKRLVFLLCFLVATSLIATSFFWDRQDLSMEFGTFGRSFFTMFMVGVAGDTSVTWTASQDTELLNPLFAVFFVGHISGCYGLIVYAVFGFLKQSVDQAAESTTLDMFTLNYYRQSPINPLLSEMCKYVTEDELQAMIEDLFNRFATPTETKTCPANEIGFDQIKQGLRVLDPPIYFNPDHWDTLVHSFLTPDKETLNLTAFSKMMRAHLRTYVLKTLTEMSNLDEQDGQPSSLNATKFAVKMLLLEGKGEGDGAIGGSGLNRGSSMDANNRQLAKLESGLNMKLEKQSKDIQQQISRANQQQLEEIQKLLEAATKL